ncbi:SDR family NAD(P)-dependent oxidoreductase [Paracandidimonas soli]|uniref:3-oxoacyl-[acyl-carrier protein] reductase n=1 Tax=Paracandidimonas soli TaxID=1917182 RepID=A0A4R3VI58_9BURK|nr:SDR family oxidoreductase [Paracandidimonas soli]TCV02625.1 3-oxoacyl-[acyl-carrier protein] reductase [Paracandidimonas soli]
MAVSLSLEGRTALVTGSGRNLGRGIALGFARAGANVVLNGRSDMDALRSVAEEAEALGVQAMCVQADVTQPDQVQAMVDEALQRFGSVDIAVSNVGLRPRQAFLDISVEDWRRVIETSLSSAFYLARAVLPSMRDRRWGRIIHMSGRDGFFTYANRAHNVTAKAGLHALAKAIAVEFGEYNITANTIAPGKMDTIRDETHYPNYRELWAEAVKTMPLRRLGTAEDAADCCLFLAAGTSYVTGQLIHLNGGESLY